MTTLCGENTIMKICVFITLLITRVLEPFGKYAGERTSAKKRGSR